MIRKMKAIILVSWFVLSLILAPILVFKYHDTNIETLIVLNFGLTIVAIISDEKLINMRLW